MAFGLGISLGPFWVGTRLDGGGSGRGGAGDDSGSASTSTVTALSIVGTAVVVAVVGAVWLALAAMWGLVMGVLLLWGSVGVIGRLAWAVLYSPSRWAEGDLGVRGERRFRAAGWFAACGVSRWLFFRERVVDAADPGQVRAAEIRAVKAERRSADWTVVGWVLWPLLAVGLFVALTWGLVAWNADRVAEEARAAEIAAGRLVVQHGQDFCRDWSQRGGPWKLCVGE